MSDTSEQTAACAACNGYEWCALKYLHDGPHWSQRLGFWPVRLPAVDATTGAPEASEQLKDQELDERASTAAPATVALSGPHAAVRIHLASLASDLALCGRNIARGGWTNIEHRVTCEACRRILRLESPSGRSEQ